MTSRSNRATEFWTTAGLALGLSIAGVTGGLASFSERAWAAPPIPTQAGQSRTGSPTAGGTGGQQPGSMSLEAPPQEQGPGHPLSGTGKVAMAAESPFSNYTAYAVVYALMVWFIALAILTVGILTVNIAMISKRGEDRIGGRDPSDVGFFKSTNWPEVPEEQAILPAMDEEEEEEFQQVSVLGIPLERRDIETVGTTPVIPREEIPPEDREHLVIKKSA